MRCLELWAQKNIKKSAEIAEKPSINSKYRHIIVIFSRTRAIKLNTQGDNLSLFSFSVHLWFDNTLQLSCFSPYSRRSSFAFDTFRFVSAPIRHRESQILPLTCSKFLRTWKNQADKWFWSRKIECWICNSPLFPRKKPFQSLHRYRKKKLYSLAEVKAVLQSTTSDSAQHNDKCVGVFQHFMAFLIYNNTNSSKTAYKSFSAFLLCSYNEFENEAWILNGFSLRFHLLGLSREQLNCKLCFLPDCLTKKFFWVLKNFCISLI